MSDDPLTTFLINRLEEDEALIDWADSTDMRIEWADVGALSDVLLIGEGRLVAECQSKRSIINRGDPGSLRALAAIYADHPAYREEWRPPSSPAGTGEADGGAGA